MVQTLIYKIKVVEPSRRLIIKPCYNMERKEDQEEMGGDSTGDPVSMSAPTERQSNNATRQQLEAMERALQRRVQVMQQQQQRRDTGASSALGQPLNLSRFERQRQLRLEQRRQERLKKIAEDDERKRQTRNPPIP